jgi:hypothetical protein
VLELYICAQGVAEAGCEDVDLMLLHQVVAAWQQRQKLALVFRHYGLAAKLNQLTKWVAAERRIKPLVDKLDEVLPWWLAVIPFE